MEPLTGQLEFGPIEAGNLTELRLLNDTTFPVRYNEKFYAEVLALRPEYTKYGTWSTNAWMQCGFGCVWLLEEPIAAVSVPISYYIHLHTIHRTRMHAAYWKGRVVGAICCRLENHDVPRWVRGSPFAFASVTTQEAARPSMYPIPTCILVPLVTTTLLATHRLLLIPSFESHK